MDLCMGVKRIGHYCLTVCVKIKMSKVIRCEEMTLVIDSDSDDHSSGLWLVGLEGGRGRARVYP